MSQPEQVAIQCRLPNVPADVKAAGISHFTFCAFEFPACSGCPSVSGPVTTFRTIDDPMMSRTLGGWLHGGLHAPI
jgi:hypothetical protein